MCNKYTVNYATQLPYMSSRRFEQAVCYMLQSEAGNNGRGKHQEVEDMGNGALPQRGSTPQSNQLITCLHNPSE